MTGIGGVAMGVGEGLGEPLGEDGLDLPGAGGAGGMDDMGMEDEMDMEDELEEKVEVDPSLLRQLLSDVEMGEKTADEAYDECCGGGEEDLGGMDELGGDDFGGMDDVEEGLGGLGSYGECMEGVDRIAKMLTEDPDVFNL